MSDLQKIEDALASTDEMLSLCRRQMDTLSQLREGLRVRVVLPEIDISQPIRLVSYGEKVRSSGYVKAGDKEYPLTTKQYEYITGKRDDYI